MACRMHTHTHTYGHPQDFSQGKGGAMGRKFARKLTFKLSNTNVTNWPKLFWREVYIF
jgi:hypothetical protein